jgi:hypothetical protein
VIRRFIAWLRLWASAFSQMLNVTIRLPLMVLLSDTPPDPDETLSAVIGRRAADGKAWARVAAVLVDALMWGIDGFCWGHCARAAAAHGKSQKELT